MDKNGITDTKGLRTLCTGSSEDCREDTSGQLQHCLQLIVPGTADKEFCAVF
jgi:hypothetical protein